MKKEYPEPGDFVIGTVENVKDYGAFVSLDEYPGKVGFIHVSEIASGWIKYIRDYVKEGQKVVCQVINVNPEKGHIDLSLKRVNEHQKREKIQEWKNRQKALKLLEIVQNEYGKKINFDEIESYFEEKYGTLYNAFESASMSPDDFKHDNKFEWIDHFIKVARENIVPPEVKIFGYVDISLNRRDAIDYIKKALTQIHNPDNGVTVQYVGAPRYRIVVKAKDYKTAEDILKESSEKVINFIKKVGGTGEFLRKVE